ncbi:MAG TPA: LacI family DNA-binding transcriptional regulator [Terracidiphilus sp.]
MPVNLFSTPIPEAIFTPPRLSSYLSREYPVNAFSFSTMIDPTPKDKRRSARNPAHMDIHTVAKRAGVSIATVSRTINHVPTVNAKMAKRVWDAIKELNYLPNTQARALVSGRSRLLGLIVSEITNPFFPELIQGFEDVAVEHGYEILISSTNYDPERMKRCIRRMVERKTEGVAVMTFGIEEPLLEQLAERKVPLVFVDVGPDRPGISLLRVDYHHGIRQGVQHLAALGHREIAFVAGPLRLHSAQSRLAAFRRAVEECGITIDLSRIVEGDHTMEGGKAAAEKLLTGEELPTAIMCSNDVTAIGVLHAAYRKGMRVPDDLSIIGFDNIHLTQMTIPPLTTIQMSCFELARAAVMALKAHVEGSPKAKREHLIETQLVVRESTGYPRGSLMDARVKPMAKV